MTYSLSVYESQQFVLMRTHRTSRANGQKLICLTLDQALGDVSGAAFHFTFLLCFTQRKSCECSERDLRIKHTTNCHIQRTSHSTLHEVREIEENDNKMKIELKASR